jgi:cell division protein FtsL
MPRLLTVASGFLALAAGCALYALKHDTRQIEARVQALERSAEKAEGDIAVLRAEHAWLARPERIEAAARALGLAPIRPAQYAGMGQSLEAETVRPTRALRQRMPRRTGGDR